MLEYKVFQASIGVKIIKFWGSDFALIPQTAHSQTSFINLPCHAQQDQWSATTAPIKFLH